MPNLTKIFTHAFPAHAPGERLKVHSAVSAFLTGPTPDKLKKKKKEKGEDAAAGTGTGTPPIRLEDLVATMRQLQNNDYPLDEATLRTLPPRDDKFTFPVKVAAVLETVTEEMKAQAKANLCEMRDTRWDSTVPKDAPDAVEFYAIDCEMV
jgi:hypothetical protein